MNATIIIACAIAFLAILLFGALFFKPIKSLFVLVLHSALGWAGLYIFNKIFAFASFAIGINVASATICGILGLPGLVLLAVVKMLYKN